jgi:4-hydroxybenzoate polyprenyltransferase
MNSKTLHAWLELLRVPNLLTVPGDVLAGWALASIGAVDGGIPWLACAASLCFYSAGLLLNDVADVEEDRAVRPGRPIPSGRVSRSAATGVAVLLAAAGLVLCLFVGTRIVCIAVLLLAVVVLYDLRLKRIPVIGPLAMGACRGLNLLLGAAASPAALLTPVVLIAAGAETLYIAMVTQLARGETRGGTRWTPARIGMLIGALLWIQAAFCIAAGGAGVWIGIALAALWPVLRVLRRRFEMS